MSLPTSMRRRALSFSSSALLSFAPDCPVVANALLCAFTDVAIAGLLLLVANQSGFAVAIS